MNSSLNKQEIVKQLNVSRERLNSLLQNTVAANTTAFTGGMPNSNNNNNIGSGGNG
jgi:hypothetical protein